MNQLPRWGTFRKHDELELFETKSLSFLSEFNALRESSLNRNKLIAPISISETSYSVRFLQSGMVDKLRLNFGKKCFTL